MKIGIVTFHAVPNYGAVFQAYGLQQYLKSLGHDVFFIDYRPAYLTTGGYFHLPKSRWHVKANVVIAYQKYMALKGWLDPAMRQQKKAFEAFVTKNLILSSSRYTSIEQLRKQPPTCDAYIAGSDQIWNPSTQYGVDPACFLDFGPPSSKRIAYAASFGKSIIPHRHHAEISSLASNFNAISIREASGCELLKQIAGIEATLVPDPTFLIDWNDFINSSPSNTHQNNHLFSYVLRSGDGLYELQKNLAENMQAEVLQPLNPHQRWKSFGKVNAMSPLEWLESIRNASAVLTNSFHGTVFAILFNRPFLTVKLDGNKAGLNTRMDHLLTSLGLTDRQVSLSDYDTVADKMQHPIEWDAVNARIKKIKAQGCEFITQALSH